jgi:7,8-dihydropterin-6-yl-methyl-4-(beta-D-ribofuranosyl)aminobenzene 5'-phosphate synthase
MTARISLRTVERVEILTVVDNVIDVLLPSTPVARRMSAAGDPQSLPRCEAPLMEEGYAVDSASAQHGLSFLVTVFVGGRRHSLLLDTGATVAGAAHNLRALGVDPQGIEAIILSHGHFDHTTGLNGLAEELSLLPPLVLHPDCWLKRRVAVPGQEPRQLPTTSEDMVRAAGFDLVERREPSLLFDGALLVTGEIERTTEFEQGMPLHQALRDGEWVPDPLILDDQALAVDVSGKGLAVITGCGHAGIVNTVRYARKLTGVERVHAIIGGFHLATSPLENVIWPTIEALAGFAPEVIVPTHCTGWRATHAIAAAFPEAFIQGSVGTKYVLERPDMAKGQDAVPDLLPSR